MTWIPASQRPEPLTDVLVAVKDEDFPVWLAYFDGKVWIAPDATEIEITHWMPLPKGPQ